MIVTEGILGGKGSSLGGHIPIWIVMPMMGIVTLIHKGFGPGSGVIVFLAGEPLELDTVVFDILTNSEVRTGGVTVALVPLIVVTYCGGVQVVLVVDGGKRIVHGNEHDTVSGPSQNVVMMYNVPLLWSSAPGV